MEKTRLNEEKEDHPFTRLRSSDIRGNTSVFYNIPERPDVVVRKSFVNMDDEKAETASIHEKAEFLHHRLSEFKKIIGRLGIRMAKTDYLIGRDPERDRPVIFGVTERIEGKSLEDMTVLDKETAEKADGVYAKIIFDLFNSYKENSYFWSDPKNAQFIFGKTKEDEKPEVYLVDVDPDIIDWSSVSEDSKEHVFWNRLFILLSQIETLEEKTYEKGYRFKKSREAIDTIKGELFALP